MSSHHTVRDKQEPALLIANGHIAWNRLDELLEWSPLVLALDGAARRLIERGIKVDWILGDFDSEQQLEALLQLQPELKWHHAPDQNHNDLEKGLMWLCQEGHQACHILGADGGRSDHWLENISACMKYRDSINWQWIGTEDRMYPLPPAFKKFYEAGVGIGLIPFPEAIGVHATNLQWPVAGLNFKLGSNTGSSNAVAERGWVEISIESGALLVVEHLPLTD